MTLPSSTQPVVDIEKRAGQFVQLRDKKKEIEDRHKEELKPINEALEALKSLFSQAMAAQGVDSMKTASGTVTFRTKATASLADASAFWNYCLVAGNFDLIDKKANVTAVRDFIDKNGVPPPGVNYNEFRDVGVTRPTKK